MLRQQRTMSRLLHKQLHEFTSADARRHPPKAAGIETNPPSGDDQADPKTGRAPYLRLKAEEQGASGGGPSPTPPKSGGQQKAYPAGRRLTQLEVRRSISHAPIDAKSQNPICWDAACHIGCHRSSCPNAHEPLPPMSKLDPTVAMQGLRRGGFKGDRNGP